MAPWTCRYAWTTRRALPTCPQQPQQKQKSSSRDSGLTARLARSYGQERLDAAAKRAIEIGARTYGSVKSILANNLDRRPSPKRSADDAPILHPNIRGPRYYN